MTAQRLQKKYNRFPRSLFRKIRNIYHSLKRENFFLIIIMVSMIAVIGGLFIYFVEKGKAVKPNEQMFTQFFDGLWYTVTTITSVGYGDKYPVTVSGKIFAMLLMLFGISLTSILSGTIASIIVDRKLKEGRGLQNITLKNHIVICGWNNNAEKIFEGLLRFSKTRVEVTLINELTSEEFQAINIKYPDLNLSFIRGDFTNEKILHKGNVQAAKAAIILADQSGANTLEKADERTILATLAIKSLNNELKTSAELLNPGNRQHLIRAKIDEILVNGEYNGFLLSSSAFYSGIPLLMKEILSFDSRNMLMQVPVPSSLYGKTFKELLDHFYSSGKGIVIGLLSEEKKMALDDLLSEGSDAIDDFIKRKFKEAQMDLTTEEKEEQKIMLNPKEDYLLSDTDTAFVIGNQ